MESATSTAKMKVQLFLTYDQLILNQKAWDHVAGTKTISMEQKSFFQHQGRTAPSLGPWYENTMRSSRHGLAWVQGSAGDSAPLSAPRSRWLPGQHMGGMESPPGRGLEQLTLHSRGPALWDCRGQFRQRGTMETPCIPMFLLSFTK